VTRGVSSPLVGEWLRIRGHEAGGVFPEVDPSRLSARGSGYANVSPSSLKDSPTSGEDRAGRGLAGGSWPSSLMDSPASGEDQAARGGRGFVAK